jgi:hypothetical protein
MNPNPRKPWLRPGVVLLASCGAALLGAADARATDTVTRNSVGGEPRIIVKGDDQPNAITVEEATQEGTRWLVVGDATGPVAPGTGCSAVDDRHVRCPLAGEPVVVDGAGGNDTLDTTRIAAARVSGGDGNDVLRGGPIEPASGKRSRGNRLFGGAGDDLLTAGADGDVLAGSAGRDRLRGASGPDELWTDAADLQVTGRAGDDRITSDTESLPALLIGCGPGRDEVLPSVGYQDRPGPELKRDCERFATFGAHPVRAAAGAIRLRLRCQIGDFEYGDNRCHARLRIRLDGKVIASRDFSAYNDRAAELAIPLTGELARAVRARALLAFELDGFEQWESDIREFNEDGPLYWRIRT